MREPFDAYDSVPHVAANGDAYVSVLDRDTGEVTGYRSLYSNTGAHFTISAADWISNGMGDRATNDLYHQPGMPAAPAVSRPIFRPMASIGFAKYLRIR